jgi:hypothetical protein
VAGGWRRTKSYWSSGGFAAGRAGPIPRPDALRYVTNLWFGALVVGAPVEGANTLQMTPELLAELYPDGPRALPPELAGIAPSGD